MGEASEAAEPQRRLLIDVAVGNVYDAGEHGLTWREFAALHGLHHGQASSALSNAHRVKLVARLKERREGSGIYVTPEHVDHRETVPYGRNRNKANKMASEALAALADQILVNDDLHDLVKRAWLARGTFDDDEWEAWNNDYLRLVGPWP